MLPDRIDTDAVAESDADSRPEHQLVAEKTDEGRQQAKPFGDVFVLSAFSRADGTRRWHRAIGELLTSPALANGALFVAATRSTGTKPDSDGGVIQTASDVKVVSFETDRTERWGRTLADRRVWTDPIVTDGVLYVATNPSRMSDVQPAIHAFDIRTGSTRWEHLLPMETSALAIADGRLYASTWDGAVVALE